jgi:histone deacetylase 1/2
LCPQPLASCEHAPQVLGRSFEHCYSPDQSPPYQASGTNTPFQLLIGAVPWYDHLRVFGCLCFPNQTDTAPNKLSPRSTPCVFLGYPPDHRGYHCLVLLHAESLHHDMLFFMSTFPFLDPSSSSPSLSRATVPDPATDVVVIQQAAPAILPPLPAVPDVSGSTSPTPMPSTASSPPLPSPNGSSPGNTVTTTSVSAASTSPAPAAHPMLTRSRAGIFKPNPCYVLATASQQPDPSLGVSISPIPSSVRVALRDANWHAAMEREFTALQSPWANYPLPNTRTQNTRTTRTQSTQS